MTRPRFSREDWLDLALRQLGREGPAGLTVERLCAAAGRTRGSLYHHFADRSGLLRDVVHHWRDLHTTRVIALVGVGGPEGRPALVRLNDLVQRLDFAVEVNVRRLAAREPQLRDEIAAVDRARIAFLCDQYRRDQLAAGVEAEEIAELEYAVFLGVQHLTPTPDLARRNRLFGVFDRLVRGRPTPAD